MNNEDKDIQQKLDEEFLMENTILGVIRRIIPDIEDDEPISEEIQ